MHAICFEGRLLGLVSAFCALPYSAVPLPASFLIKTKDMAFAG
jgi:hypothetical protein